MIRQYCRLLDHASLWYLPIIGPFIGFLILTSSISGSHAAAQENPSLKFFWRKALNRGPTEFNSVELDGTGKGKFQFKERNSDSVVIDLVLQPATVNTLLNLFIQADFLNEGKDFVSTRKVADMGMKTIQFEMGSRKREVSFNYTEDRGAQQIVNFFENLSLQEKTLFEIDLALKYDRLGIPKQLDELAKSMKANRIVAPERFASVLDRIYQDDSIINYARVEARKLLAEMQKSTSR